ncbi:hypothetical protein DAPPUDRAFT_299990 [Daphnia pulex]|uniref:Uncharacterized protein n=1 Tax=Daphnia pulex TaxID=6669 RepID=E9FRN1_DAPPU|nr:hypothetical protein DAPPUDRAFT_299990 [Daphnia pulex]|eukprot:EFX89881.1 hypothetical protein DAPPUDRAFT_299990 [Daphnia pulex]
MNCLSDKYFWLMLYLLLASTRDSATSSTADPAVHPVPVFQQNSAEALGHQLKIQEALRTDILNTSCAQAPITINSTAITFLPIVHQHQPTFPASTQLPALYPYYQNESSIHSVDYNVPEMAKMLSHRKAGRDVIPYVKRSGNVITRAWKKLPVIRREPSKEPTYNLGTRLKAAVGFVTYVPLLICCTAFFFNVLILGALAVGYNVWDLTTLGQGAVRKRGMGNWYATVDLNKFDYKKIFSFDFFLSSDHSRTLATLAAHVQKALIDYKHSLKSDVPTSRSYLANPAG